MQALIDGDCLVYEIGAVGQYIDEATGELVIRSFDWVSELLDARIEDICRAVGSSEKPILYLTGDEWLWKMKARVRPSLPPYKPNFRIAMATEKDYKGGRKVEKPYHYNNIRAYLLSKWDAFVAIGIEADDAMAMEQTKRGLSTIICTRDKDLRQVPGWHYGWECGKQGEFGPILYDGVGTIELVRGKSSTKIVGGGFAFFCSQLLTGDVVDNIPGLKGYGPVRVVDILGTATTKAEYLEAVRLAYVREHPEDWQSRLREQCNLLWMVRGYNEDGSLKFFDPRKDV